jgi:hypothetical protein
MNPRVERLLFKLRELDDDIAERFYISKKFRKQVYSVIGGLICLIILMSNILVFSHLI